MHAEEEIFAKQWNGKGRWRDYLGKEQEEDSEEKEDWNTESDQINLWEGKVDFPVEKESIGFSGVRIKPF